MSIEIREADRILDEYGVLIDPTDNRSSVEIASALGLITTKVIEPPLYDPSSMSVEQKVNC